MDLPPPNTTGHYVIDLSAVLVIIGSLAGAIPIIAALAALVWYGIQIYESKTARKLFRARRKR